MTSCCLLHILLLDLSIKKQFPALHVIRKNHSIAPQSLKVTFQKKGDLDFFKTIFNFLILPINFIPYKVQK